MSTGFSARLVETADSVFPSSPENRRLVEQGYVEAGCRAAEEGADALFINTVGDYGLWQLRSELSIPVVGAGEAAIRLASSLGKRFGIVTIWPASMGFIYEHVLADSAAKELCAGIRYLSEPDALSTLNNESNFVTDMRACHYASIDAIVQACEQTVAEDRADVIIMGCTCMAPTYPILRERITKVPLIDPLAAGYQFTQLLVDTVRSNSI